MASAGLVLVLLAAGTGAFDLVGALLALAASLTYTTYILVSDRIIGEIEPFALVDARAHRRHRELRGRRAWSPARSTSRCPARHGCGSLLIALVSTVVAVSAFFAGLRRVGPSEAAILSTFEPPVTVALAFVALGERLTPAQLFGGAMVLAAVVLLQLRPRAAVAPAAPRPPAGAGGLGCIRAELRRVSATAGDARSSASRCHARPSRRSGR